MNHRKCKFCGASVLAQITDNVPTGTVFCGTKRCTVAGLAMPGTTWDDIMRPDAMPRMWGVWDLQHRAFCYTYHGDYLIFSNPMLAAHHLDNELNEQRIKHPDMPPALEVKEVLPCPVPGCMLWDDHYEEHTVTLRQDGSVLSYRLGFDPHQATNWDGRALCTESASSSSWVYACVLPHGHFGAHTLRRRKDDTAK